MKIAMWLFGCTIVFGLAAGCGDSPSTPTTAIDAPNGTTPPTETASVAADGHQSPANAVAAFYEALKGGEAAEIAALLTDTAREETAKSGLDIRSPGSDTLTYEIGEIDYVTEARDGAHVKSVWTEYDEQGQPYPTEVIWVLRKQADGWRIAGMATQVVEGQLPLLFNFENPEDMLAKREYVETEIYGQQNVEQVDHQQPINPNQPIDQGQPSNNQGQPIGQNQPIHPAQPIRPDQPIGQQATTPGGGYR